MVLFLTGGDGDRLAGNRLTHPRQSDDLGNRDFRGRERQNCGGGDPPRIVAVSVSSSASLLVEQLTVG
jgi:hypothetical protein